jgi:hypothetical protein
MNEIVWMVNVLTNTANREAAVWIRQEEEHVKSQK